MRIVGPNCMGIAAFDHNMIITFGVSMMNLPPELGPVSIVSQSGAFGSVTYAEARQRHLGVRLWATTGNESDVNVADCLTYYVEDPETKVILLYFEASRDGKKLMAGLEAAKEKQKPVVAMKVGSSDVGAGGRSIAHRFPRRVGQRGRYRPQENTTSTEPTPWMSFSTSATPALAACSRPVTASVSSRFRGGVGVLMADHAVKLGLDVSRLSEVAQEKIKDVIPFAGTRNPVDITGKAVNQPEILEHCLNIMIEEGEYDVIIVYFAGRTSLEFLRRTGLTRIREKHPTAAIIISVTMDDEAWKTFDDLNYLVIPEPTRAVRAASALMQLGQRYAKADLPAPPSLLAPVGLLKVMSNEVKAKRILAKAGIPTIEERLATSAARGWCLRGRSRLSRSR